MTEFLPKFPFSEGPRDYQKQALDAWIANKYKFFYYGQQRVCRMVVWLETTQQTKSVVDYRQGEQ